MAESGRRPGRCLHTARPTMVIETQPHPHTQAIDIGICAIGRLDIEREGQPIYACIACVSALLLPHECAQSGCSTRKLLPSACVDLLCGTCRHSPDLGILTLHLSVNPNHDKCSFRAASIQQPLACSHQNDDEGKGKNNLLGLWPRP